MLRGKSQAEASGIKLGQARAERNQQITFKQYLLHCAQAGDATERKWMVGRDHAFAAGGSKDGRLQQFGKLLNLGTGSANAGAKQQHRVSTSSDLLGCLHDFLRR